MAKTDAVEVLGQGKFIRLVRRNGWEFAERTRPVRAAFIAALTDDGRLILTREYREALGNIVVGCPAGLVGDLEGYESESLEAAVKRELLEEAGFEAQTVTFLTEGPTSAGLTAELIAIVLARGLRKVTAGGGDGSERITVHEVPLADAEAWIEERVREGCLVDPKVYAVLYFIRRGA
jgi:ADP-ribose pyrophosphatase